MMKFFVVLALGLCACSSDDHEHGSGDGHTSEFPSCEAISQACHSLDTGDPGPINECHDLAHDAKSDQDCQPRKDECVQLCSAADGGDGHDHEH